MSVRMRRLRALLFCVAALSCVTGIAHAVDRSALPPFDFADPGLEQASLNATNAPDGYVYGNPPGPLYGSGWDFNPASGIARNGSAFNNPTTPSGDQVGFIQGGAYSWISQQINPGAGRYRIGFIAAQRQLPAINTQKIFLRVGGSDVFALQPTGSTWTAATSPAFDLPSGATTIEFHGDSANTTGQAGFVDDVRLLPANLITDGGFEQPAIPAVTPYFQYQEQLVGALWSFAGGTGIALSNSNFNNGVAPQGSQVALLQGTGAVVSQTFAVNHAGRYRLTFKARQRVVGSNEDRQTLHVTVDSLDLGTITPTGPDYVSFVFDAIKLPAGSHTLTFTGVDDNVPGGHTAFIDDVRLESVVANARRWSDGATWGAALPPQAGDDVTIPAGSIVLLDGAATARELRVDGELHCADENIALNVERIVVTGRFVCGSPATPYEHHFVTTLLPPTLSYTMGDKSFLVMAPGVVELHGKSRTSWTQLDGSVSAGAITTLTVASAVDWSNGDKIVIAPTNADPHQAEVVSIHSVSLDGKTITLKPGTSLQYAHYGAQSSHTSTGTVPNAWTLDERAEVGLLTRNIVIQGDDTSAVTRIGGHMMTMVGTTIHASGIELSNMGQHGLVGRYPFHWHLVQHAAGQYLRNSSIHDSYHRCVTVHGTRDVTVADNVCYNFSGHGYFLEDGNEENNLFDRNLGILARKPGPGAVLPTDGRTAQASNGPAVFWISNPNNFLTGNVAAGSEGTGFWYHTEAAVTGDSAGGSSISPKTRPFGVFADNRVHSSVQGFSSCKDEGGSEGLESADTLIENLTVNNVDQGVWPCSPKFTELNATFDGLVVANTRNGMQSPSPVLVRNSLFLAYSANEPPAAALSSSANWGGIYVYDQGFSLENAHFENYVRPLASAFVSQGGAHKWTYNRSRGLSFSPGSNVFTDLQADTVERSHSQGWSDVIHDLDGSLVGVNRALVSDSPLLWDASCSRPYQLTVFGYGCGYRYAQVALDTGYSGPAGDTQPVTVVRSDGVIVGGPGPIMNRFVTAFIANGGYRHIYRFDKGQTRTTLRISVNNAMPGESSIHEILDVPPGAVPELLYPSDVQWQGGAASSVADLLSGPAHRYYHRADRNSLLVKMGPAGANGFAQDSVLFCLVPLQSNICPGAARTIAPPAVAITSPAHFASGSTVALTGAVSPSGAALAFFVDDASGNQVATGSGSTLTASLADGRYTVRLVATYAANETYTALQSLTVGEPVSRIEITSLVENGTYLAAAMPQLAFTGYGPLAASRNPHIHWLVNGVDQGEAGAGPVSLATLNQGRYDLQLAFANADESLTPFGGKRTIYVARNGELADFEDGLDLRTTFTAHELNAQPIAMSYLYGRRENGRVDGAGGGNADDGLLMETEYVAFPNQQSRFRLALQPAQDWTAYQTIQTYHIGPAYEVILIYANGTESSLGSGNAGAYQVDNFSLNGQSKTQIVAVELRQNAPASSAGCVPNYAQTACVFRQELYRISLLP